MFLGYGVYKYIPGFWNAPYHNAVPGMCGMLDVHAIGYGTAKIIVAFRGQPAKNIQVDIQSEDPNNTRMDYCHQNTDALGVAIFDSVPIGQYKLFFNKDTFPKEYGSSSYSGNIDVRMNDITEKAIELAE